jgi:uncharacterized protein (DUF1919 family)
MLPGFRQLPDTIYGMWRSHRQAKRLRRLAATDFTIISNNCWGSALYPQLGKPYLTPFVGLYLKPACYLKFLADWRSMLRFPMSFVSRSVYDDVNLNREKSGEFYPIGIIGDNVEIQFLHYKTEMEAREKWHRRAARVVRDDKRVFVKFCDHDQPSLAQIRAFGNLPFEHKVCFVAVPHPDVQSAVLVPGYEREGRVTDGFRLFTECGRVFDMVSWLNGGTGRLSFWQRLH